MATRSRQRSFTSTSMYGGHAQCFPVSTPTPTPPSSSTLTRTKSNPPTPMPSTTPTPPTSTTSTSSSFLSHRKRPPATSHGDANCWRLAALNERLAAATGDASALVALARSYETGRGVSLDFPRALSLYTLAAKQNDMHGHFHLGRLHNSGLCGLSIDTAQAAHHYALAAMQGHAPALVNLGVLYHTGSSIGGIAKNVEKAVELYRRAATQGVPKQYKRAWYNLGVCYETGCGVELDLERARECYEKSAGEGGKFLQGVCSLGMCYQYGVGGEVDLEKAVRLYRRAARKGCARAAFYLGLCYENGHGVEESDGRAERLFRHARDLGLEQAASYLQRFQQRMNALEKSTSTDRKNGAGGDTGVGVREEEAGRRRRSDAAGMSTSVTFNEQRRQRDYVGGNARKVECGHIGRARIGLSGVHDARRHVRTSTEQSDGVDAKSTRRRRMESDWKQTQKQEQKQQEVEKRNTGTEERGTEWVCMAQVQEGSETDFDTDVDSLYSLGGESSEAGSMSSSWTWSRRGSTASGRL